jgi:hypothetical protein
MLRRIRDLKGWTVHVIDETNAGTISDFYFDDQRWTIRYLIVETGNWLMDQRVLVSPMAVRRLNWDTQSVQLTLDRARISSAPPLDWTRPVDRQYEAGYAAYYGYSPYWVGPGLWGATAYPMMSPAPPVPPAATPPAENAGEQHLRSIDEVSGYHIAALDGEIGHVEDFLFDNADWRLRYLLIDTSNWIGGRTVLVDPEWVDRVEWSRQLVHVDVTRDAVASSPDYHPGMDVDEDYQAQLRDVYRRSELARGRR